MNINGLEVDVTLHQLLLDLRNSLSQNGIYMLHTIKPVGNNIMVSCPSHKNGQEKKPSCGISLTDTYKGDRKIPAGTAHCFTCDYTATITEFISLCFGYKDGGLFGNKWIKANYNVSTSRTRHVNLNFNVRTSTKKHYDTIDDNLLEPYRYTVDYMYKRGLTDDVIEQFDIGYDEEQDAITIPVPDLKGDIKWVQRRLIKHKENEKIEIIWVGRFIKEKHPEYVVKLAQKLKEKNYNFEIKMIGNGELLEKTKSQIEKYNLTNQIKLVGAVKSDKVRSYMEKANIFICTSDKNERWGVVLNEAMNSGCAVIAYKGIGGVPFLIKNNENGLAYTSLDDFYKKTP